MASGKDRNWFHTHGKSSNTIRDEWGRFASMSDADLRKHIETKYGGDFARFKKHYNSVVNSHHRGGGKYDRKYDIVNPFDQRSDLKIDIDAVGQDWHHEKGADVTLKPLESIILGKESSFLKEGKSPRYQRVLKGMLGEETFNIHNGGFKPVEEYSVSQGGSTVQPVKEYKDTLKQKATGEKPIDSGKGARQMLATLARRGVSGVKSEASTSSMSRLANSSIASNSNAQILNNKQHKQNARKNLLSMTSNLIKHDTERKEDLETQFGETVTNLATMSAINAGYDEMRTLQNQPISHFDRKKD